MTEVPLLPPTIPCVSRYEYNWEDPNGIHMEDERTNMVLK